MLARNRYLITGERISLVSNQCYRTPTGVKFRETNNRKMWEIFTTILNNATIVCVLYCNRHPLTKAKPNDENRDILSLK